MCNATKLIQEYTKCGNLKVAESLWNAIHSQCESRNIKTYGLMMNAYIKHGHYHKCLELFEEMNKRRMEVNDIIYLILLKSCAKSNNFEAAKLLHFDIMQHKNKHIYNNIKIQNSLISIYSSYDPSRAFKMYHDLNALKLTPNIATYLTMFKLISHTKDIESAMKIHETIKGIKQYFEDIKIHNGFISMYSLCDAFDTALVTFNDVKHGNINECKMDDITYLNIIKCCSQHKRLVEGKHIHRDIINTYLMNHIKIQNALMNMYYECCDYECALHVFDTMRRKDITTYSIALKICAKKKDLYNGKRIHQEFINQNTDINDENKEKSIWFYNELMKMYCKSGDMDTSETIWNFMNNNGFIDVVSYGIIMKAYIQLQQNSNDNKKKYNTKVLQMFDDMECNMRNEQIIVNVLMACCNLKLLNKAMQIYMDCECRNKDENIYIQNCLISLFSNCDEFEKGWSVYLKIKQKQIMDNVTFVNILSACCRHRKLNELKMIENDINVIYGDKNEIDVRIYNVLLKGYMKCINVEEGKRVFEIIKSVHKQDIIGYNLMLQLYLESGDISQLMNVYQDMQKDPHITTNLTTYLLVIKSCRMDTDLCHLNKIKADFDANVICYSEHMRETVQKELTNAYVYCLQTDKNEE